MVKEEFPILSKKVNNKPLIYLDNASTTQKPASVIDEIQEYYECTNSNIHRGVHHLSQKATEETIKSINTKLLSSNLCNGGGFID